MDEIDLGMLRELALPGQLFEHDRIRAARNSRTSAGVKSLSGCGVTSSGNSSSCRFFAASRPCVRNALDTTVDVGTPRFSR